MNTPKIEVCKKICNECGFNCSTRDTLYADFYNILKIRDNIYINN